MTNTAPLNPIQEMINAALAAQTQGAANLPAVASNDNATPGRRLSMDDLHSGLAVDKFLKVDIVGLMLDDGVVDGDLLVEIDLSAVQACRSAKWSVGSSTVYAKSYDGSTDATSGKPWVTVLREAESQAGKVVRDYPACEIPMTLLHDAKELKTGKVLAEEGTTLGYTTSTTGFPLFKKAFDEARATFGPSATVHFRLVGATRKNARVPKPWGVIEFSVDTPEAA